MRRHGMQGNTKKPEECRLVVKAGGDVLWVGYKRVVVVSHIVSVSLDMTREGATIYTVDGDSFSVDVPFEKVIETLGWE